ncbi:TetR/AcrR family transcriptional regulator C-terminal domain-containing protein [Pseudonocardia sp. GCM10023141]|uniref:TetR/AcrR family transcriptional regulator C-terminal domain-containing protein n=1 Tax=Pseudonocardia sp. GCM10023141 TaxID=3252653 RepID=UPI0036090298
MTRTPIGSVRSTSAMAKGRVTLSREDVVVAAGRLLDETGIDGLSMRSLARTLGTGPATLYWHVRDRDELLAAVLDDTLSAVEVPADGGWQECLLTLSERMRAALLPRPALVTVLWGASWRLGPTTLRLADETIALVAASGLPDDEVADAYLALIWFVLGFVHAESQAEANAGFAAHEPPGSYPHLSRFNPSTDPAAMHRRFTGGLRHLLAGIAEQAGQHRTEGLRP